MGSNLNTINIEKKQLESVVITGLGIKIRGIDSVEQLPEALQNNVEKGEPILERKIGRYGLRYKDTATKLALFAGKEALGNAGLLLEDDTCINGDSFGVIVSSNMGNFDTVCNLVDTVRNEGAKSISPMDLPNASSNVVAASLAIKYQLKSINLMVCNGATSGIDALYLASNAIKAGRAERILVVGVEPSNRVTQKLLKGSMEEGGEDPGDVDILNVAAALVVENEKAAKSRGAKRLSVIGPYLWGGPDSVQYMGAQIKEDTNDYPDLWLMPKVLTDRSEVALDFDQSTPEILNIDKSLGTTYGAEGILQAIVASLWLEKNQGKTALITNGGEFKDGISSLYMRSVSG